MGDLRWEVALSIVCHPKYAPNTSLDAAELVKEKEPVLTAYAQARADQIKSSWPRLPVLAGFAQAHYVPLLTWAALLRGPMSHKDLGERPLEAVLAGIHSGHIQSNGAQCVGRGRAGERGLCARGWFGWGQSVVERKSKG